ncbi:MAG: DTW domain-containing protein [Oceanospirillaceae bacterium]|nr:DTW domain-containing protein [Oceanospirillaceae bacterium]
MAKIENPPRKPFVARGSSIERCPQCRVALDACICEHRGERSKPSCEFWLLTHHNEFYKPTNTGQLIRDVIANTRVFEWSRTEPCDQLLTLLDDPDYAPCLVFPASDDYVDRMVDTLPADGRIPAFIILDGTWRQARRMFRLSRYLQALPVIEPKTDRLSNYQLRRSTVAEHLCTAEVAIALLEQFGEQKAADHLEGYFNRFNQQYIESRRRWDKALRDV